MYMYLNGSQVKSASRGSSSNIVDSINAFTIGNDDSLIRPAGGYLAGISAFGRALSNNEIAEMHMNMGHPTCKGDIQIENDVWIGATSTIMSGVTIHNGAIVGAGSTVTKDVPPFAIVAGNPGKIVKYRFTEEQIKKLLQISWWDWEEEQIKDNAMLMWSSNIDEFINKFI